MWIALAIVVIAFLAVLFLPLGGEVSSVAGSRRWYVILAGLHIPIPKSVTRVIAARIKKKGKQPSSKVSTVLWQDLAGKLRRLRSGEGPIAKVFGVDDLRSALEFVLKIVHTLRIRVHRLHVVIATPDPAWTGIAYGMACAIIGALPSDWAVSVEADWVNAAPAFTYRVEVSVIPARALGVLCSAVWKKAFA